MLKWEGRKEDRKEKIVLSDKEALIVFPYWPKGIFHPDYPFWKKIGKIYPDFLYVVPQDVHIPEEFQREHRIVILPGKSTLGFIIQIKEVLPELNRVIVVGADIHFRRIIRDIKRVFPNAKYRSVLVSSSSPISFVWREKVLLSLPKFLYVPLSLIKEYYL